MKLVFLLFFFFLFKLGAQELPPIQNYTPIVYDAGNQNWSLSQSIDKHVYAANNNGLLEFNGSEWKLYPSPNGTPLKSVKVIENRIYTGSYMEFGYWKKDEFENLKYVSVSSKLKNPLIEDEHFWNIKKYKDWVLFQSLDRIYIYNTINDVFEIIDAKTTRATIQEVDNKIYFQKIGVGFYTIENGNAQVVSDDEVFKNDIVVGAYSLNKGILIVTEQSGFYFLYEGVLSKWYLQDEAILSNIKIYSTLELKDGSLVLGTISTGVYFIDHKGAILSHINQEKGLNNNTVLSLFQDVDLNLWLGLDNGLSVVNIDSPFNEYIDHVGELGVVYTAILFNDILYLGTNQGLFFKKKN